MLTDVNVAAEIKNVHIVRKYLMNSNPIRQASNLVGFNQSSIFFNKIPIQWPSCEKLDKAKMCFGQCTTETEASAIFGRISSAEASVKAAESPNRRKNVIFGQFWPILKNFFLNFLSIFFLLFLPLVKILNIANYSSKAH